QQHFEKLQRDPVDVELETVAQTWSEHCSHKTLAGRIAYRDDRGERQFENMLKETIFAATEQIRANAGDEDWCVSVFEDNAGIVTFDDENHVCFKVETHNHPSALEPYGGANTGIGGVIRDPLGTGLGAKPIFNTNVFCFAPPDTPFDQLPPGVLHPRVVARGVVAGVRDYGNRMGIPTVNGAVFFDNRYLGNPLVYCGNVAMIPRNQCDKHMQPGDLVVAVGGRTGRDGIHGATFSSAELTPDSEMLSGGAVQIGNAITEKMVVDVILQARDEGLYSAITDCGAGGFSSAVGEMGEQTGATVHLDRCPLKYSGLSYTEIWISEAQERMVLAVPPQHWDRFHEVCQSEGVEATAIGEFTDTGRLVLKFQDQTVADLSMSFLHDGRPPVIRDATYQAPDQQPQVLPTRQRFDADLRNILAQLNVASKEWIIRQYDHEVQAGSVVKPLVGVRSDGPSDAAVVKPNLNSNRGLVVSNGMNPHYGDLDPYWMAAGAIDEAVRNCVAVGADPNRIAILDNFCWGNTDRPEVLGSLVRAALACRDVAIRYQTPFISGKDSLYNEFSYEDGNGHKRNVAIPSSLLISALGQIPDVNQAVTMDLKRAGNQLFLIGCTADELGGSHFLLCNELEGGQLPRVDLDRAPLYFAAVHRAMRSGLIRSCHDLSEGGLAACLAEMSFSGELGLDVSLEALAESSGLDAPAVLLFSESHTRFVCEVAPDNAPQFLAAFSGLKCVPLGDVCDQRQLTIQAPDGSVCIESDWLELKQAWQTPLKWD
ncbi:MAG: phosphoribosylformylglycinamidine synthase subunit PurL, partial [Planctomycetaceae bacterium]